MKRLMQPVVLCFIGSLTWISRLAAGDAAKLVQLSDEHIAAASVAIHQAEAGEADFRVPKGQRQLFLDDHGIAKLENLKRTMHQPDKKGAVIRPN